MSRKPTYEELKKRFDELEQQGIKPDGPEGSKTLATDEWKRTFDSLPDLIAILDNEYRIVRVNKTMAKRLGVPVQKASGLTCYECIHGLDKPPEFCPHARVLEDGKEHSAEIYEERLGGWFLVSASPLYDTKDRLVGGVHIARDITKRKQAEEALKKKEAALRLKAERLEEVNTTLRVLLKERQKDKVDLEEKVLSNIKDLVLPYIERIKKTSLDNLQKSCIKILESNLEEIVSPFARKLSSRLLGLTPTEIRVADLVKEGKTTKEIAEFMNLSHRTVESHRENIRDKLGIKKSKTNLRTYLLSM
jgi:PAS domain S-box-containing protein